MNAVCSFCAMEDQDLGLICEGCSERRADIMGLALRLAAEHPNSPTAQEINAAWHELEIVSGIAEALLEETN